LWEKPAVRVSAFGDVIKVWVWALGSLVIGLWLTPVAYNGGKALFEISGTKDFNGIVNKIAAWSGGARLEDFFMVCWPVVAALLLLPLIEWLRLGGGADRKGPWLLRLPHGAGVGRDSGQPIRSNRWGPLQALTGFLATFGCFTLIGFLMVRAGAFGWESDAKAWREDLIFDIGLALAVAALVEVFFRCAVLGIFLRAMKAPVAIALAALMFGGVRYLLSGFSTAAAVDAETLSAIHLTGIILGGGDLAARVLTVFLPWFAFGCVLGWARWRTASVWLPAGLLMGWLLADRLFSKTVHAVESADRLSAYLASGSVQTGLVPLLGVVAVGGFVHLITQGYAKREQAKE
jgi:hypothetical protein